MKAQDVLKTCLKTTNLAVQSYLSDLSDADLFTRPHKECNHIAYQLGHVISSNVEMLEAICPGVAPKLPEGFAAAYTKENASSDDPKKFHTKQQYLDLLNQLNEAVNAGLAKTTEEQLDAPGPEQWRQWFPTVGDIWVLIVNHALMHCGQWVPARRILGKPIVI
jgi:hypothetical protein